MLNFIDFLFLPGYNIRKYQIDYWSTDPDSSCNVFAETMSQKCYLDIMSNIYVADNLALDPDTRMTKVKPLYNILNEKRKMFDIVHKKY